jgi:MFS family permease
MSRFPALAHRDFRLYFIGQSISLVGGFAHGVAISWLGYKLTGSVAVLGALGFVQLAPALIVSPIAGLYADRYPRRRLLTIMLTTVALLGIVLAVLAATGWITATQLMIVAALRGVVFACEIPVRHAFLGDLVRDRSVLPNAVALHSSALNTARFIGPALGGLLIGSLGEAACLMLHPIALLATLIQLQRIRTDDTREPARAGASFLSQYFEGWRHSFSDRTISQMLIGVFLLGFGVGPYNALMPATVAELHGAHPELIGIFLSCAGLGAMSASLSLAARRGTMNLRNLALAGNCAAGLGLLLFCSTAWIPAAIVGMVLVGFGTISQAVSTNITIQQNVTDAMRGRVLSIYTAMFMGAMPIGSLFFGQLGQWIGAANAQRAGALLALSSAALTLWWLRTSAPPTQN